MRHKNSTRLFGYWDRLRNGRSAPKREEIEPSDIRDLLGDTFILDVSGSLRTISYRLAGTRLCAAFGNELKGQGFLSPWDEADCFEVTRALGKVYRDNKPHLISSIGKSNSGKFVEFETLLLPIQPIGENNHRVLGISTPSESPFWLGAEPIENISVRTIRSVKNVVVAGEENHITPTLAPDFSSINAGAHENGEISGQIRRVAHLTVHNGGKS